MTRSFAVVLVCLILAACVALSGCATSDSDYCPSGMSLRIDQGGAFCQGFGSGFNWQGRVAAKRQPWWI